MKRIRLATLAILVLCAPGALAARLELPLRVSLDSIRQALEAQVSGVYRDGRCRSLTLQAPSLRVIDGRMRLAAPGSGVLGMELLGRCQNAAAWRGSVEFTLAPRVGAAGELRMRIVDSRLTDGGGSTPALGLGWEMAKRLVHSRLEQFSYPLGAARSGLVGLLASTAPLEQRAALESALAQLRILEPQLESESVLVPIALELPDAWLAFPTPPATPAAPLTEAELEALDRALEPWDAFVAYAVKHIAVESPDPALRLRLFTFLLDARYRLSALLAGETSSAGDPARALFLDAWNELRALVDGTRYAFFIDAGDALVALDRAAPGLGMQLSVDGLRRLARSLRPGATGDPLAFDWTVDPELRRLFDVPEVPAASPPPGRSWLDHVIRSAHAEAPAVRERWIPKRDELDAYETHIGGLLAKAATAELDRVKLAPPYDSVYRHLVPTTALIESCWRQYVKRGDKVTYLRSAAASVGIMQVNQRVWRGFYDVEKLRWDTAYNLRAGAQILMRYVKDYAIPYAQKKGEPDHVARAAYAVYNAGPRAVGRFAKVEPHPREKRVDDHLWTLYRGVAAGGQADLRTCGVKAAAASN
jgi:hypothetical protein